MKWVFRESKKGQRKIRKIIKRLRQIKGKGMRMRMRMRKTKTKRKRKTKTKRKRKLNSPKKKIWSKIQIKDKLIPLDIYFKKF